jgi:hypothetical protein
VDPDLASNSKLDKFSFFLMPDMEGKTQDHPGQRNLEGWDTRSQAILRDYIAKGGTMIIVRSLSHLLFTNLTLFFTEHDILLKSIL